MQPRVLRTPDAAQYLGLTASTLEKMRLLGNGPRFVKLGARAVGYSLADLDAWIDARTRANTSDPGSTGRHRSRLRRNQAAGLSAEKRGCRNLPRRSERAVP
jgi:predicted DNA-binding transcriptional regulator AlpA